MERIFSSKLSYPCTKLHGVTIRKTKNWPAYKQSGRLTFSVPLATAVAVAAVAPVRWKGSTALISVTLHFVTEYQCFLQGGISAGHSRSSCKNIRPAVLE